MKKKITVMLILSAFLFTQYQSILLAQDNSQMLVTTSAQLEEIESQQTIYFDATEVINRLSTSKNITVELPSPSGTFQPFVVSPNNTISKAFKEDNPGIGSFDIFGLLQPDIGGKLTVGNGKVYIIFDTSVGLVSITPSKLVVQTNEYDITVGLDTTTEAFVCSQQEEHPHTHTIPHEHIMLGDNRAAYNIGPNRITFRMVVVATGEFTVANGGTAGANTVITNSMNAINIIYEKDINVTFTVIDTEVYPDPAIDPFTPENSNSASGLGTGDSRTNQAAEAVALNFNNADFDIGHVFHTTDNESETEASDDGWSSGGVAGLGVVCSESTFFSGGDTDALAGPDKAAGWSGSSNNTTVNWIQLLAHEIGHMFNATHTFNGTGSSCTNNIESTSSYEIASGTTIMAYQGICSTAYNIPSSGDADSYFHTHSLSQMIAYATSAGCGTVASTGNTAPTIDADVCITGPVSIPLGTPFTLIATGSDAETNATTTYTWEQYDEDGADTPTQGLIGAAAGANADAPLFRSFPPSIDGLTRTLPAIEDIASGTTSDYNVLPTVERTINFVLTARDGNGGVVCDDITFNVDATGPLTVNNPAACPLNAGDPATITWNTNGSDALCSNVDVLMSVDGGINYPYTLASSVSYSSGTSGSVTIPAGVPNTTEARFKVVCKDLSCLEFFNINDTNCEITSSCLITSHQIDNTNAETFDEGDAGLNLGLNNFFGEVSTGTTVNATGSQMNITTESNTPGTCLAHGFTGAYGLIQFTVDTDGTYSFPTSVGIFEVVNIFENTFDETNPCASWVVSSANDDDGASGGSISGSQGIFNVTLTANTIYFLTISGYSVPFTTGTVSFSGAGNVILIAPTPSAPYDGYTYIAVDNTTGNIEAVSATADFVSLTAGTYTVYGVGYQTTLTPSSWEGQTLSAILSSGGCILPSNNTKALIVNSTTAANTLVINEVDYDQPGTDGSEYIELYNFGTAPVDLSNFDIELVNGSSDVVYNTIDLPAVSLTAGDYYVICGNATNVPNCDLVVSPSSNLIQNGAPDALAIVETATGNYIDALSYEGDVAVPYVEGSGAGLTDIGGLSNGSIARFPNGVDTDVNNVDFVFTCGTPGEANTNAAYPNAGTTADQTICSTETAFDLTTTLTGADAGGTWSDDDATGVLTGAILDATGLAAGTYNFTYAVVLAGCTTDSETVAITINAQPSAGTATPSTIDNTETAFDLSTTLTGADAGGVWSDDDATGQLTGSILDASGLAAGVYNFTYTVAGTAPCVDATASVAITVTEVFANTLVINEVDYDQPGSDAGEYIELYNFGTAPVDLSNFDIELVNGSSDVVYNTIDLPAVSLTAGDYYVICGNATNVPNCDLVVSPSSNLIQNGAPDALAIVETATGNYIDALSYEGDVAVPYVEGSGAGLTDIGGLSNGSIARFPNGVDTDVNNVDFVFTCGTPGEANTNAAYPNAGTTADQTICSTETAFDLTTTLTGADAGGVWSDDDATGGLTGSTLDASGIAAGTYNFTYTVTNNTCEDSEAVLITVEAGPNPGLASAGSVCVTETAFDLTTTLTGADAGGTWSDDDATGALAGSILDAASAGVGTYNFTYTVTGTASCSDASVTVAITVTAAPSAGTATPTSICSTETAFDLSTTLTGADAGGTWSDDDATGVLTGAILDATGLAAGTYNFTYTVALSGCTTDTETVAITINTAPNSGTAILTDVCITETAFDLSTTLTGADAGGTWSDDDATGALAGSILDAASAGVGTYNFTYTVTGTPPCIDASVTVAITVTAAPSAGTATPTSICSTETAFDLSTTLTGADAGGTWSDDDATGVLTGAILDATGLAAGTYNFTYAVVLAGCTTDSETVAITINAQPSAGTATPSTIDNTETAFDLSTTLTGADAGGVWSDDDATGQLTGSILDATGLAAGVYNFTYTVAGTAPCLDASVTVAITVTAIVNSTLVINEIDYDQPGTDGSEYIELYNFGTSSVDLSNFDIELVSSTGTTPYRTFDLPAVDLAAGDYYVICGNAANVPNCDLVVSPSSNLIQNGAPDALAIVETASGTYIDALSYEGDGTAPYIEGSGVGLLDVGSLDNGSLSRFPNGVDTDVNNLDFVFTCGTPGEENIFDEYPNAGVSTDQTICDTETAFDLFSTLIFNVTSGTWSDDNASGGLTGSILDATGLSGTFDFTYTVDNGTCSDAETVSITINTTPNAGTATDLSICDTETAFDLATTLTGADAGGVWTDGAGTTVSNIFDASTAGVGVYDFTYTVSGDAPCTDNFVTVSITVNATPNAGTANNTAVCITETTFDLNTTLTSADTGGIWTGAGGTVVSNTFDVAAAGVGIYNFTYTVSANGCTDDAATVIINVNEEPNAGTATDLSICETETTFDLATTLTGADAGGVWTDGAGTTVSNIFDASTAGVGVYSFTYIVSSEGCPDATATVNITVSALQEAGIATPITVCTSGGTINLISGLTGADPGGIWTDAGGNIVSATFDPTAAGVGIYDFTYTVNNVFCTPATDDETITVTVVPEITATINGENTCVLEIAPADASWTISWSDNFGNTGNGTTYDANVLGTPNGTVTFIVTNPSGVDPCFSNTFTADFECCIAIAGSISTNANSLCPGEALVVTVAGNQADADYTTYFLLLDNTTGLFIDLNTTGTFAGLATGDYTVYSYNESNLNGPSLATLAFTTFSEADVLALSGCFDLSAGEVVSIPEAFTVLGGTVNADEGSGGGFTPSFYNTNEIEITGGTPPYFYNWATTGFVTYSIGADGEITIIYQDGATWSVTVTDSNSCDDSGGLVFNNIPEDNPVLDIDNSVVTPDSGAGNGTISISVSGGNCGGIYDYVWTGPASAGSLPNSSSLTGLPTGWYSVVVTCGSETTIGWYWVPRQIRGRGKIENNANMMVAPNPFANQTQINFALSEASNVNIAVFNVKGKQVADVFSGFVPANEPQHLLLNVTNLQSGLYICTLTTADGVVINERIMIAK